MSIMRRTSEPTEENDEAAAFAIGDLVLDRLARRVTRGQTVISLQPREFRLLEYLMRHQEQVVTRTMLLEQVWDFHFDPRTNVVETPWSVLTTSSVGWSTASSRRSVAGSTVSAPGAVVNSTNLLSLLARV